MTSHDLADIPFQRLARAEQVASATLLEQRDERGNWEGELSTSALSTATATFFGGELFFGDPFFFRPFPLRSLLGGVSSLRAVPPPPPPPEGRAWGVHVRSSAAAGACCSRSMISRSTSCFLRSIVNLV